jgi:RNase P/RNase MRP subunit p29
MLPSLSCRLESLEEMRAVWEGTAVEMTANMADSLVTQRLDYHGCQMRVEQCRNPMLVGREGVCVKDSTTTIHLAHKPPDREGVDPSIARISHVPKSGTTFTFFLPGGDRQPERLVTILGINLGRQSKK